MAAKPFRLRRSGGGSSVRGGDAIRDPRQTYVYAASGGLVWGGAAIVSFESAVPVPVPETTGGGFSFGGRTAFFPIKRRKRSDRSTTYRYEGDGGLVWGGEAETAFNPAEIDETLLLLLLAA